MVQITIAGKFWQIPFHICAFLIHRYFFLSTYFVLDLAALICLFPFLVCRNRKRIDLLK